MKDDFLKAYRQTPPAELVEKVYGRIETMSDKVMVEKVTPAPARRRLQRRSLVTAGIVVLLLLLLSPLFSPTVRALMEDVVHKIGGLTLLETDVYPDSSEASLEPSEYVPLEEARERIAFDFSLPTWVPERYTLAEEVYVIPGFRSVSVRWTNEDERGDTFSLKVSPADPEVQWVVGPESIEVVDINGQEAQFVTGGWDADQESWNPDIARMLRWEQEGIEYQVSTSGAYTCPDRAENRCPLTKEVMIEIAESVPPLAPDGE